MPMLAINLISTTKEFSAVPLLRRFSNNANVLPELLLEALIENASDEDWNQAIQVSTIRYERFKADSQLKLMRRMVAQEPVNFSSDQWCQLEQEYLKKTAI